MIGNLKRIGRSVLCGLAAWIALAGDGALAETAAQEEWPGPAAGIDDASWSSLGYAIAKATQQAKLAAADGASGDRFGFAIALSGDTAVVGAPLDDIGSNVDQGSVYVFERFGSAWVQQAKLVASDGQRSDRFGAAVSISGDTVLVGAPDDEPFAGRSAQGSAYVFVRSGQSWVQLTKLLAGDGASFDNFGTSVAIFDDTALVGAPGDDGGANVDQGSAYIFARNSGSGWVQQARLVAADGTEYAFFGSAVALAGGTALVGAPRARSSGLPEAGAAYVYVRNGTSWAQQAQLGDPEQPAAFGTAVALDNDTALIGAPSSAFTAGTGEYLNAAYVFVRRNGAWVREAKLLPPDRRLDEGFAASVGLSGNTALVGASAGVRPSPGSAYMFVRSGSTWGYQSRLQASDGEQGDRFGFPVSLIGDTVLIGANTDDSNANVDQGALYVFSNPNSGNGDLLNVACQNTAVTIKFWDNATQDGDIINLTLDNAVLVRNFNLNQCGGPSEPQGGTCVVTRVLPPNSRLPLRITALNVGSISPNTAALKVTGGCVPEQQSWRLLTGESAQIFVSTGGGATVTLPGAPTNVVASAINSGAVVSFNSPASNGGASITGYTVTSSPGGVSAFFAGTSGTVTGLTNGVTYTFTVRARNTAGDGPASSPSNPVTPGGSTPFGQDRAFDINGDGNTDLLWYNASQGNSYYQLRSGQSVVVEGPLFVHPTWRVVSSGDLDGDGRGDLLWYNSASGDNYYWLMNGPSPRLQGSLLAHPLWRITHSPDLDGDGRSDLLWINPGTGETHAWMMNGVSRVGAGNLLVHPTWRVTHTGDLNGDRRADLVWYNDATGETYFWLMNGMAPVSQGRLLLHPTWRVVATGDLNADGRKDLLWHNRATGESYYWLMSGGAPITQGSLLVHPSWVITGTADVNGDGRADLLWHNPISGESYLWIMSGVTPFLQLSISTDWRWRNINQ